jgi:tetratricopeptide (TPR) repeat protein
MEMCRNSGKAAFLILSSAFLSFVLPLHAQQSKTAAPAGNTTTITTAQAISLAQQGRCAEAIPVLKRAMTLQTPPDTRKQAGVLGLHCSLNLDKRDSAADFIRLLSQQFPRDPDVLFVLVHAYSDLSTRMAQELATVAPQSQAAHKLNAEALEMQGKWDEAQREYEDMIAKEPNTPGLHFLLGRSLVSRPDVNPKTTERAKEEFQKELQLDPKNAAAHYVLGELAAKDEQYDEAIAHFSEAARLNPNFAEAYVGWGFSLLAVKRYQEAIDPLRMAERLTPDNPAVHYSLAQALIRTGQKEAADKEFAIHRSLTAQTPNAAAPNPPTNEKPQ